MKVIDSANKLVSFIKTLDAELVVSPTILELRWNSDVDTLDVATCWKQFV